MLCPCYAFVLRDLCGSICNDLSREAPHDELAQVRRVVVHDASRLHRYKEDAGVLQLMAMTTSSCFGRIWESARNTALTERDNVVRVS